jgi:clan AA aspartic protease (TIGR02281 family)
MKKVVYVAFLFLGMLTCYAQEGFSALYRWTDVDSQIHYSATPPSSYEGTLEIKRANGWQPYQSPPEKATVRRTYIQDPAKVNVIQYEAAGNIMVVKAVLNKKLIGQFIVDTGASYTVIHPDVAKKLELSPDEDIPPVAVSTANGKVLANLVNMDSITLGTFEVPNVMTAIMEDLDDESEEGILGLIGQDCLNRFRVTINSTENQLILEPIRPLSEYAERDCVESRKLLFQGKAVKKDLEKEAFYYKKAISVCPDSLEALGLLAEVYHYQKKHSQAIQTFRKVLDIQPNNADAHYRLGLLYAGGRRYHQARVEFQKALDLKPDHEDAQEALEKLQW